jgi:hypothetical protein
VVASFDHLVGANEWRSRDDAQRFERPDHSRDLASRPVKRKDNQGLRLSSAALKVALGRITAIIFCMSGM